MPSDLDPVVEAMALAIWCAGFHPADHAEAVRRWEGHSISATDGRAVRGALK